MAEEKTFEHLVREAFIAPLRSVLIVDDQYPTWDEIFNSKITGDKHSEVIQNRFSRKKWNEHIVADEVQRLISEFRRKNPGFIIDIHDGLSTNGDGEEPKALANHLHQSDLLILDYNLEGGDAGTGGDMARKIISSVLENPHFNLVVVHTSEDLYITIYECLRSLMVSCTSLFEKGAEIEAINEIEEIVTEKEQEEVFDRNNIYERFDMSSYFDMRKSAQSFRQSLGLFMQGKGAYAALNDWVGQLGIHKSQFKSFFYWAIHLFEKKYLNDFSNKSYEGLTWNISADCKWLRTSRGFVCFVEKGPEKILIDLEKALVDWKPTPSILLSAKYRDEISKIGTEAEDTVFGKGYAFAKFYETICKPCPDGLPAEQVEHLRHYKFNEHVYRQSELFSFLIADQISAYGKKIYEADALTGFTYKNHYGINLDDIKSNQIAISQYNQYICCLPSKKNSSGTLSFEQLDSGHIFKLDDNWWVCATPACDLQPGQNTIAFKKGTNSTLRPFTAIKLHLVTDLDELTSRHINSGSYCYIEYEGKILGLGVKSPGDDSTKPAVQKVDWRAFVAQHGGVINNGKLSLLEIQLELDDIRIKSEQKEAEIVAKLRYEYALNYIQKVGASVSRIGLGYVAP